VRGRGAAARADQSIAAVVAVARMGLRSVEVLLDRHRSRRIDSKSAEVSKQIMEVRKTDAADFRCRAPFCPFEHQQSRYDIISEAPQFGPLAHKFGAF